MKRYIFFILLSINYLCFGIQYGLVGPSYYSSVENVNLLATANNGYPVEKMYIPNGLEIRAADGPTSLELARQHNQDLLKINQNEFKKIRT